MADLGASSNNADDVVVTDHDVLCGRGVSIAKHPGNQRLRALARSRFDASYCTEFSSNEKKALAEEIISHIKNLKPPGRFLRRPGRSTGDRGLDGPWEELSHKEAVKKACQSLRDCNRPDRDGYATKVEAPKDVVLSVEDGARTGLSLKERAAMAAMEKDKLERESRTANLRRRNKNLGSMKSPPAVAAASTAHAAVAAARSQSNPHQTGHLTARPATTNRNSTAANTAKTGQRNSLVAEANLKSDPSLLYPEGVSPPSSSTLHGSTGVVPHTGNTMIASPVLTSSTVATMPGTVDASAMDPLEPIQIDHHTPHDVFRHATHHEGTSATMPVPVSASHHSGSPVRGHNIFFEDDCPASPTGMGGHGGDGVPTASRLVAGLTAPFSPVTWNHGKSSDLDDGDDVGMHDADFKFSIPQSPGGGDRMDQQAQADSHVSLGWRPYSGPPAGSRLISNVASLFQAPHQHHHNEQDANASNHPGQGKNTSDPSDHEPFNPF